MPVVDRARVAAALPGYTIGTELGSGAYGLVLAGHHQELDRQVAIKVLSSTAPTAAAEFRAEARLLSRLDHPHIVRTFDYVSRGDLCLLVMELLPGGTLAARRLPPDAACAVVLAVADALAHAHDNGVLHRDIKPGNILFTADGQPKVADFGISKVIEGSASTASRIVGTPKYMAPEQIIGDRLSPATDLYALSVILYELLAGTPMTDPVASLPELLRHHLEVVPPPPPGVPRPLAEVVMRSLAKRPDDRHPSARDFALDLADAATGIFGRHWLDRVGVPLRVGDDIRMVTVGRRRRGTRAHRAGRDGGSGSGRSGRLGRLPATALAVLVVAVAFVGGGAGWAAWGRESPPPEPPPPPPAWQPTTLAPGTITTVFGTGTDGFSGDGGPAVQAEFDSPQDIALDLGRGFVYIADAGNHRIRRIDRDGVITTVAGVGTRGFSGDSGPAVEAQLAEPDAVVVAPDGTLYIADTGNHRVRKVGTDGIITTIAGQDEFGFAGEVGEDGLTFSGDNLPAVHAKLNHPNSLLLDDETGDLYISDGTNNRIRRIDAEGIITTVAGSGVNGFGGDGGPATRAHFSYPAALAAGPDGSLYIADQDNHRIRRVDPDGVITTIAGTGERGYSGDGGPADEAMLDTVGTDIVVDDAGNIYFSDGTSRVRRIDTEGMITTIAGTGTSNFSGNGGPATAAELRLPRGMALDDLGILYIVDTGDDKVRGVNLTDPNVECAEPPCPPPTS